MNDKDLFKRVYTQSGKIEPPPTLQPQAVEDALRGVKRKHIKANAVLACVLVLVLAGSTLITAIRSNDRTGFYVPDVPIAKEQSNNYDSVYNTVKQIQKQAIKENRSVNSGVAAQNAGVGVLKTEETDSFTSDQGAEMEYSDTNLQVQGVQEADIVKTDGAYIYALDGKNLTIVKADAGTAVFLSKISVAEDGKNTDGTTYSVTPQEMFINGNIVTVLCEKRDTTVQEDSTNGAYYDCIAMNVGTQVRFYTISDKTAPAHLSTLSLSGSYVDSRMVADYLYITSNYTVQTQVTDKNAIETYVPVLENETGRYPVRGEDICIAKAPLQRVQYTTVASVDVKNPSDFLSSKSVMGGGTDLYCSTENLYLAIYDYRQEAETLQILKYALQNGSITLQAQGNAQGNLLNQFSMDEYNGYFRIVTQTREMTQQTQDGVASVQLGQIRQLLYVFDANMQVVGQLENHADREFLQSVRFDKDYAYFVTFLQTDPLFTVDLTDPANPQIVGELKIPGFSTYMHPFTQDRLLGIGLDADEQTGMVTGLKLSMFDTSDKTNVTEKHTLVFAGENTECSALYDHKAVLIDAEKNVMGVPVFQYGSYDAGRTLYYYVFAYDEQTGFIQKAMLTPQYSENTAEPRGLYIGGFLYVVAAPDITVYRMEEYTETSRLHID